MPWGHHGGPPGEPRTLPLETESPPALRLSQQPPPSARPLMSQASRGGARLPPAPLKWGWALWPHVAEPAASSPPRFGGGMGPQAWVRGPSLRGSLGGPGGGQALAEFILSPHVCPTPFLVEEGGACLPSSPPPCAILEAPAHPTVGVGGARARAIRAAAATPPAADGGMGSPAVNPFVPGVREGVKT